MWIHIMWDVIIRCHMNIRLIHVYHLDLIQNSTIIIVVSIWFIIWTIIFFWIWYISKKKTALLCVFLVKINYDEILRLREYNWILFSIDRLTRKISLWIFKNKSYFFLFTKSNNSILYGSLIEPLHSIWNVTVNYTKISNQWIIYDAFCWPIERALIWFYNK